MTLHDVVSFARERFIRAGIDPAEAALDAELLARHTIGWDRATLLSRWHVDPPANFGDQFAALVRRREQREPVAFIVGCREFWNLEFEVSPAVLVPRPETELIVEELLVCATGLTTSLLVEAPLQIADVGTGSGCLAVAAAVEMQGARVIALDRSMAALRVAGRNAFRHHVIRQISFACSDLLSGLRGSFDLILSNPPYIPHHDLVHLPPEVRWHEPAVALDGGEDGLHAIRRLLTQSAQALKPGGCLIFEFGAGQLRGVSDAIYRVPHLEEVRIREDLQGIPRTAVVRRTADPGRG